METVTIRYQELAKSEDARARRLDAEAAEILKEVEYVIGFPERVREIKAKAALKTSDAEKARRQAASLRGEGGLLYDASDLDWNAQHQDIIADAMATGRITYVPPAESPTGSVMY